MLPKVVYESVSPCAKKVGKMSAKMLAKRHSYVPHHGAVFLDFYP